MNHLTSLYKSSLSLLTDLYELTMAYGYWKSGHDERNAVFSLFFRENPFDSGFSIACGLGVLADYITSFSFSDADIAYLRTLKDNKGNPLFEPAFLEYLGNLELKCDIDAVPEGSPVFPFEPVVRVTGPLLHCQVIETALLNIINYQTLIATKAARVYLAAQGDPIMEFGLRRSHGIDGGVMASRAAYIGGCSGTSNVLAGKLFGIPVKGTHAHSWVMAHDTEMEAFEKWAEAMPDNAIMLVDTYDTIGGVRHAIEIAGRLRADGHEMVGIRLDSGDLHVLSLRARSMLDEAGFENVAIVGSSDLDEYAIAELKRKNAPIHLWGVGTKLVTGHDDPALGGVYKIVALEDERGEWEYKIKVSEEHIKQTIPGKLQVRRFERDGRFVGDIMYDAFRGWPTDFSCVDQRNEQECTALFRGAVDDDVLVPVFENGRQVYEIPSLGDSREATIASLDRLPDECKRLEGPDRYTVGMEKNLHDAQQGLIQRYHA